MEGRTNNHSSIRFWIIIACVVVVSASISFLITSPRHKKRDRSTVKQYSSTSDNSSDAIPKANTVSETDKNANGDQEGVFQQDGKSTNYVQDTWLTDLEYIKKGDVTIQDSTGQANTGVEYAHYMYSSCPYSEVIYNLNGNYDTLTALWSISYYDRDTDSRNSFEIYADDTLVYTSPTITGGDLPVDVSVDINECKLLTILFKDGTGSAELANIRLSNKTERTKNKVNNTGEINLPCWLTDLEYFFNDGVEVRANEVGTANTEDQYSHYMFGREGSRITYYLNGKYEKLTGLWSLCSSNRDATNKNEFMVYADGKAIYTSPKITKGDQPVEIEVDIKNCEQLKIVFTLGNGEAELGNIRLFPAKDSTAIRPSIETTKGDGEWLTSLNYLKNDGVTVNDEETRTTNTGEEYSHYMYGSEGDEIIYYLNGEFASISGVWAIYQEDRNTTEVSGFEIFADDVHVYTAPKIKGEDVPVLFAVNINNCQKLRIVFTRGTGAGEIGNIVLGHNVIEPESSDIETQPEVEKKPEEVVKNSAAPVIIEEKPINVDSPFDGNYWVIFTEETRDNRVEATSIDTSGLSTGGLYMIWNSALYLSKTNSSTKYVQYYLNENGEWCKMGAQSRFSNSPSNVIASNLDVYDSNGNRLLEGCAYSDIDWDLINQYR